MQETEVEQPSRWIGSLGNGAPLGAPCTELR
jgi:hypothetical protein